METNTATDAERRYATERRAAPRRGISGLVVAGIYALMVLGAPLIVRYGPEPEVSAAVARVAVGEVATPRCAYAPEFARSCTPDNARVRVNGKAIFTE